MTRKYTISLLPAIDQINAKAYYTGRSKKAEEDPVHNTAEIAEDENLDIVEASISKAIAKMQGVIGIYAPNTIVRDGTSLEVELTLPSNFDLSAEASMSEALKQYCENTVLYDWFAAVSPQDAEHYALQATMAVTDIRRALMQRGRPRYESEQPVYDTIEVIYGKEGEE